MQVNEFRVQRESEWVMQQESKCMKWMGIAQSYTLEVEKREDEECDAESGRTEEDEFGVGAVVELRSGGS